MERCQDACRCLCVLLLCSLGLLRVGLSQSCDNVVTAGIESVSSAPQSSHEQYGLFLNLQSPVTCTGKVTKFEYAYYKGSGGGQTFTIQLSLWRPGANGMYTKVYSEVRPVTTSSGGAGLVSDLPSVLLQDPVYVASGDVVGLFMETLTSLATLVYSGSGMTCTSESDTNTLDCSMTSALQLRVQATVEPILCSLDALSIDQGTFTAVDGTTVTESQPVNTVITYECDPELVLIGSAERTCEIVENSVDGEWSGSVPSCEMPNVIPSPTSTEPLPSGVLGSLTDSISVSFTMDVSVITDSSQGGPALPTMEPIGTTSFDVVTSVTISSVGSTESDASTTMSQELIGISTSEKPASLLVETVTEAIVPHVTASITVGPMQVPSRAGSSSAVIIVIIVVLLLLVLGIVGVIVVFTLWRRHRKLHITSTAKATASGFDNSTNHITNSLYGLPLDNGNININGDPQYYSEIKSGTGVSFHKQDLGALNEAGMLYEFGDGGEYDVVGGPSEPEGQYEKPGAIFTTDTAETEFKKASKKGNVTMLRYANPPTSEPPPGYYTALSSTSQYYKLFEQALVPDDDDVSEDDDDDDDDASRRPTKKYVKPAGETEELIKQLNRTKVKRIQANAITLLNHVGSGQYGDVHKALWRTSSGQDTEVAVKKLKAGACNLERIKFLQEAAIMAQFSNQNVLKLLGMVIQEEEVLLVMELMSNGDLRDYLIHMRPEEGHTLPPDTNLVLLGFCRQVCLGMTYLSGKGFVHRDLAARNILISGDRICKISDFGMARDLEDENYYFSQGGKIPVKWTAPEAINYRKYSTLSDVWSFGCLMYEIWSLGQKPYGALSNAEVVQRVSTSYRLPPPPGCPRSQYELMISTWHPLPKKRPNFHDIMLLLLQHDASVLEIPAEALSSHPEAGKLGAALEAGQNMYLDVQNKYNDSS